MRSHGRDGNVARHPTNDCRWGVGPRSTRLQHVGTVLEFQTLGFPPAFLLLAAEFSSCLNVRSTDRVRLGAVIFCQQLWVTGAFLQCGPLLEVFWNLEIVGVLSRDKSEEFITSRSDFAVESRSDRAGTLPW